MFSGLMSRWTMPCRWAWPRAYATSRVSQCVVQGKLSLPSERSRSDRPAMSGMMYQSWPPAVPESNTGGCGDGVGGDPDLAYEPVGAEALAQLGRRTLRATSRAWRRSWAK